MKVLVFGSLNIDRVYYVEHLVKPGETIAADSLNLFCGGKGLNQAVAFARAGMDTYFAGAIGTDGDMLKDMLTENGVDIENVLTLPGESGHAVIQVDEKGQNSIIIVSAANGKIEREYVDLVLTRFEKDDMIVLQNEISNVAYIIRQAHERGLVTAFNPSPFNEMVNACDLKNVDYLLINETEGEKLSGKTNPYEIITDISNRYPKLNIVLTLGENGSVFYDAHGKVTKAKIFKVVPADTTAAGDTFTGFFLASLMDGNSAEASLKTASAASAISVSRNGAAPSIPYKSEVMEFLTKEERK